MIDKSLSDERYYEMKGYFLKKIEELGDSEINGHAYLDLAEEVRDFSFELFEVLFPELVDDDNEPFDLIFL